MQLICRSPSSASAHSRDFPFPFFLSTYCHHNESRRRREEHLWTRFENVTNILKDLDTRVRVSIGDFNHLNRVVKVFKTQTTLGKFERKQKVCPDISLQKLHAHPRAERNTLIRDW